MGNCCAAAKPDQDDVERGGQETAGDSSPIQKVNPDEKTDKDGPASDALPFMPFSMTDVPTCSFH
jgi:hypothetical protein